MGRPAGRLSISIVEQSAAAPEHAQFIGQPLEPLFAVVRLTGLTEPVSKPGLQGFAEQLVRITRVLESDVVVFIFVGVTGVSRFSGFPQFVDGVVQR